MRRGPEINRFFKFY